MPNTIARLWTRCLLHLVRALDRLSLALDRAADRILELPHRPID